MLILIRLTKKALKESDDFQLLTNHRSDDYKKYRNEYVEMYKRRPPVRDIPTKNMLKALRLFPWLNSGEDWARLHAAESFLNWPKQPTIEVGK